MNQLRELTSRVNDLCNLCSDDKSFKSLPRLNPDRIPNDEQIRIQVPEQRRDANERISFSSGGNRNQNQQILKEQDNDLPVLENNQIQDKMIDEEQINNEQNENELDNKTPVQRPQKTKNSEINIQPVEKKTGINEKVNLNSIPKVHKKISHQEHIHQEDINGFNSNNVLSEEINQNDLQNNTIENLIAELENTSLSRKEQIDIEQKILKIKSNILRKASQAERNARIDAYQKSKRQRMNNNNQN